MWRPSCCLIHSLRKKEEKAFLCSIGPGTVSDEAIASWESGSTTQCDLSQSSHHFN